MNSTRRVPHVKKELLTLPEHFEIAPGFGGFVLLSLIFFVVFYLLFLILSFSAFFHGFVSLFSTCKLEYHLCIFRHCDNGKAEMVTFFIDPSLKLPIFVKIIKISKYEANILFSMVVGMSTLV